MVTFREKRRHPRAKIEWSVTIRTDRGVLKGSTLDVSAGGASIRCQNPPLLNEICEMTIRIPELERTLAVEAQVVWSTAEILDNELALPTIGVSFTNIADHDRWFISTAVSKVLKQEERVPPRVEVARRALEKILKECMEETSED